MDTHRIVEVEAHQVLDPGTGMIEPFVTRQQVWRGDHFPTDEDIVEALDSEASLGLDRVIEERRIFEFGGRVAIAHGWRHHSVIIPLEFLFSYDANRDEDDFWGDLDPSMDFSYMWGSRED